MPEEEIDNVEEKEKNTLCISIKKHRKTKGKKIEHLAPWQYKKGQSGNPEGRPDGVSMKVWMRNKFMKMTPAEREEYVNGLNKTDVWKMAEGNPDSDIGFHGKLEVDLDVKGAIDQALEKFIKGI
jgi:hypothetical protein